MPFPATRARSSGAMRPNALLLALVLPATVAACAGDSIPTPLRATPPGNGPVVVFDLAERPLPNIPLPNDMATFPDPTSRTGLRLNASLVASTNMERITRAGFDQMEGWGTYAPITVSFTRPAGADPHAAAIDLEAANGRFLSGTGYDFSNDPVYVINLATGIPVPIDAGNGNFPVTVSDPTSYFPNDVKLAQNVQNLFYETAEEGAGLLQSDYQPSLDQDMDGVLDHPNVLGPARTWPGIDNLMTWYERETDTLVVRPLLPLEEKTEYAVVLTDRLVGYNGQPVKSPFAQVYHAAQVDGAAKALGAINDPKHAPYFGDIAGTGLNHVAFLWTFTTQPTQEDMRLLRDGLYGKGPFARLAAQYPPQVTLFQDVGLTVDPTQQSPGWQNASTCKPLADHLYTLRISDIQPTLEFFLSSFGYSGSTLALLEQNITDSVDHIVIGTFPTPYLMGDPASPDPDSQFNVNFKTGEGTITTDQVHFYILVPKQTPGHTQPFPVTFWEHGVTGHDDEVFIYAGHFAKQGIATIAIDMPEHGFYLDPTGMDGKTAALVLSGSCLGPLFTAIAGGGRAHDLNFDGVPDSGGLWWTAHAFHTRDNVRQGALDMMNAVRILRSFDGTAKAGQDYNGNGDKTDDLAGDFDGDGVPDLGGPNVSYFAAGESLGGFMSEVIGGIDPYITATAPVSGGGGGATDIAPRSYGVAASVLLQTMSPLVIALPAAARPPQSGVKQTNCTATQSTLRFYVSNLTNATELEIACLDPDELGPNMTVVITNVTSGEARCGRTFMSGSDLALRVPVPASIGDKIDIQVYPEADVVDSYKTCNVPASVTPGRRVRTWEQPAITYPPVGASGAACPMASSGGANQCQQFWNTFFPVGSTLTAPQEGLGYLRNTPDFRRLLFLVQSAFDPADPINYAPYYMMRKNFGPDGTPLSPRALLGINTVGDGFVNISSGVAFARAAGAVPFLSPDALSSFPEYADYVTPQALFDQWGGQTANDLLVSDYEVEGISRLARTPAGAAFQVNYDIGPNCMSPPAFNPAERPDALFDADWFSQGLDHYDQQHPLTPLRSARDATLHPTDPTSLDKTWGARIQGTPGTADSSAWPHPLVAVANVYLQPTGQHSFDAGDPCQAFDASSYIENTMARFFATGGRDLYYLSHPTTHTCMVGPTPWTSVAPGQCPFLR